MSLNNCGILLLAAGQSRRFGDDKLMAKMPDNRTVIEHSMAPLIRLAHNNSLNFCVVTRANNHALIELLSHNGINFCISESASLGMGLSIAEGIEANKHWRGWLIALSDMPNIRHDFLSKMLTSMKENPDTIIRPYFNNDKQKIPTHPVYFPKQLRSDLLALKGDQGAKSIIQNNSHLALFDDENLTLDTIIDVDTAEILQDVINKKSASN